MNTHGLQRMLNRLGLPGFAGLILLGAVAWGHWSWLPQQQAQNDILASQVRRLRHELSEGGAPGIVKNEALTMDQAWQAFWLGLPLSGQRTTLQSDVLSSARTLGLTMTAIQFKGAVEGVPGLWRQRMVMPVEGRYADVRAWMALLLAQPALSLDALDIQRTDVMSETVKARVSVSIWWRKTAEQGKH